MSQTKKLPFFNYDMNPRSWTRKEMRKMSGNTWKVLCLVGTFTIGFQRREAKISLSLMEDYCGMCRKTCIKSAKELVEMGLITHEIIDGISVYGVVFEDDLDNEKLNNAYKKEKKIAESGFNEENQENNTSVNSTLDEVQEISTSGNITLAKGVTSVNFTPEGSVNSAQNIDGLLSKRKSAIYRGLNAGFLDKIYFDFETKNFVNTEELNKYVVDEYLQRIHHFNIDPQDVYDKACKNIVERVNTRNEVKKAGVWLLSLFRDASYGNVYKYGATNAIEKKNFETNYELFCSLKDFSNMRVDKRFLIVNGKEYNFYSSPEMFKEALSV